MLGIISVLSQASAQTLVLVGSLWLSNAVESRIKVIDTALKMFMRLD